MPTISKKQIVIIAVLLSLVLSGAYFAYLSLKSHDPQNPDFITPEIPELVNGTIDFEPPDAIPADIRASGEFEVSGGGDPDDERHGNGVLVFEKYDFYDEQTGEFIDLESDELQEFYKINSSGQEIYLAGPGVDVQRVPLFINISPYMTPGEYKFLIKLTDERTYTATLDWPLEREGITPVEATRTGDTLENEDGTTSVGFEFDGVDLNSATITVHKHPDASFGRFGPGEGSVLWLSSESLEDGVHRFLIKESGVWYYAEINNPEDF